MTCSVTLVLEIYMLNNSSAKTFLLYFLIKFLYVPNLI